MSDSAASNFAKFVPGFDFLQNLAKSTAGAVPNMPNVANWIAPTLSVEELDKRINELKTVQFWLDQNAKALAATVQALEVQKMTLATLKGMNLNLTEMANSFMPKAAAAAPASATGFQWPPERTAAPAQPAAPAPEVVKAAEAADKASAPASTLAGLVDPMHMWSALTQQFQSIAASAMAEAGKVGAMAEAGQASAVDMGKTMLKSATEGAAQVSANAVKAAKKAVAQPLAAKAPASAAAKKAPAKKAAAAPKAARRT